MIPATSVLAMPALEAASRIVLLGDIHAQWNRVQPILDHEFPEGNGVALCVGDLNNYPAPERGHQIFFVHGNHDNFRLLSQVRSGESRIEGMTPLFAGDLLRLGGLTVAGIPGVYSERLFNKPEEGPLKYFRSHDLDRLASLPTPVDLLLMHEAPSGVGFEKGGTDRGQPVLTDLITSLRPRLVLFGHHHVTFDGQLGETRIVGLDYPKRSYGILEIDRERGLLRVTRHEATLTSISRSMQEFVYPWSNAFPPPADRAMETGGSLLFGGDILLDREKRILDLLKSKHGKKVEEGLVATLTSQLTQAHVPNPRLAATSRAGMAVNTVLPFVARYAAAMETDPELSLEQRGALLRELHEEMTQRVITQAIPDIVMAFEGFLIAMGLLKV